MTDTVRAKRSAHASRPALLAAALCSVAVADALAQSRTLVVEPTFSVSQTYTNNRDLSSTNPEADYVTQVQPGVRVSSRSGPVQGTLDYQLSGTYHAHASEQNEARNTLNAALQVVPLDDRFMVAARASLSRQSISAFGTQQVDPTFKTSNTTDVGTLSIAPKLRGTIAGVVDYDARVSRDITRVKDTGVGDSANSAASLHLGGRGSLLSWALDGSRQVVDFSGEPRNTNDRGYATLGFAPNPDTRASLRGGVEYSDALGNGRQRTDTWGLGLSWIPSERTQLSFDRDQRYFGASHQFNFQHRAARSVWTYSDSRDASSTSSTRPGMTAYDLYDTLFASLEPDPARRDALVRAYLQTNGIDPGALATTGFLTANQTLSRRQQLGVALNGLRSSVTLTGFRSESQSLNSLNGVATAADIPITQFGMSLSVSHRLTPNDALSLALLRSKTLDAGPQLGNDLRSVSLNWTTRPGPRTAFTLGGRRVVSDGSSAYTESGLNAVLSLQF